MDESFLKVKEVHDAMDTLKYISADDEIRAISDLRQKTINDYNSELTVAKQEGLEEGKAEGIIEGKRETALSMLLDGLSPETISKYTGLSVEDITSLDKPAKKK